MPKSPVKIEKSFSFDRITPNSIKGSIVAIVLLALFAYFFWEWLKAHLQWYFIVFMLVMATVITRFLQAWKDPKVIDLIKDSADLVWNVLAVFGVAAFVSKTVTVAEWTATLPMWALTTYTLLLSLTASTRIALVVRKLLPQKDATL